MADNEISLLGNIRDSLRDSNKKAAEDAAAIEDGVLTQKQMLKAQKDGIVNAKKSAEEISKLQELLDSGPIQEDIQKESLARIEELNENQKLESQFMQ